MPSREEIKARWTPILNSDAWTMRQTAGDVAWLLTALEAAEEKAEHESGAHEWSTLQYEMIAARLGEAEALLRRLVDVPEAKGGYSAPRPRAWTNHYDKCIREARAFLVGGVEDA